MLATMLAAVVALQYPTQLTMAAMVDFLLCVQY